MNAPVGCGTAAFGPDASSRRDLDPGQTHCDAFQGAAGDRIRVRVAQGYPWMQPVVSIIGTLVPRLVGGAVVTEAVFGWPGMGRLAVEAANGRDYPLIVGITVVVAAVVVVSSLVVDLAYTWLDPRIRLA